MIKTAAQLLAEIGDEPEDRLGGRPRMATNVESFDCDREGCNGPAKPGRLCKRCIALRRRRRAGVKKVMPAQPKTPKYVQCTSIHNGVQCTKRAHKTSYDDKRRGYAKKLNPHRAGDVTWM